MKNETNTQHTPKLSASVIQLRPFIKDKAFGLYEVLGMVQKAINIEASELLKENEQLKNDYKELQETLVSSHSKQIDLQALNAELLEALKEQNKVISGFAGIEAWIADRELKEKWQAKIYPAIEKSNSAIEKASK